MTTFTVNNMIFEIVKNQHDCSLIKINGKKPQILFYNLPSNCTIETAKILVEGFLLGYEKGINSFKNELNKVGNTIDIKRNYFVEKEINND